uniref:DNA-directed RNA polymerase subunit beta'' n=1 Tax=Pharnaceum aurantium TaxID=2518628 RepID=A0A411L8X9_9CARY|nr:RNA polymerase beta' subunit [Pharnaceum aurantium]
MAEEANFFFDNHNQSIDGTAMKRLISRLIGHFGMTCTSLILDQVKTLGFAHATATSISLGIDDLLTLPSKRWLVRDAEEQSFLVEKHHQYGNISGVEKLRQSIDIWHSTSEYLRQEMNPNFRMTDPSNPVHIMSFSGARGNVSQIHQLVGMRGLMSDPQGQMIELPIQSNLSEGLSLTEYIISCYGARKGVIDTAVRTADAGYLTRRLVEVVQHIVVRRKDCGSTRGISVNLRRSRIAERLFIPIVMGRVLADDIYMGSRCMATRNQDIGVGLLNRLLTVGTQAIYIRTPFICRSTSWICRLCYGRSPIHGDLVDLGEAVGIIAGQTIGEPGTQLTLRTFHTGGVFTGGAAEYVRAPWHGKIKFNEDLVHPTRTRHGHPAFLCSLALSVTIEGEDLRHNVTIPPKSLLLVQNNQYVESEQVIAEICGGTSTSNLKERVQKHIYSDSEGEMHWSTGVYHAPANSHGNVNVYLLPNPSRLWLLSGRLYRFSGVNLSLYKDQDQKTVDSPSFDEKSHSKYSVTNDEVNETFSDRSSKKGKGISDSSKLLRMGHSNLLYTVNTWSFLAKRRRRRLIIPFQSKKRGKKEIMPISGISMKLSPKDLFQSTRIFAFFENYDYHLQSIQFNFSDLVREYLIGDWLSRVGKTDSSSKSKTVQWPPMPLFSEILDELSQSNDRIKVTHFVSRVYRLCERFYYLSNSKTHRSGNMPSTREILSGLILRKDKILRRLIQSNDVIGCRQYISNFRKKIPPKYKQKIDPCVSLIITKEVHILSSSSLMVRNNSLVGVETQISLKRKSRVSGVVRLLARKKRTIEVQISWGQIRFPRERDKKFQHRVSQKSKDGNFWISAQRIILFSQKSFLLYQLIPSKIKNGSTLFAPSFLWDVLTFPNLFPRDLLKEGDNGQLRVVKSVGRPKDIRMIPVRGVEAGLVWTGTQAKKSEEASASVLEVRTNGLIRDFLRIAFVNSAISSIGKRNDPPFLSQDGFDHNHRNPFESLDSQKKLQESLKENKGTLRPLLERPVFRINKKRKKKKEWESFQILSSSSSYRMGPFPFNGGNSESEGSKKDHFNSICNSLGPFGISLPIGNFFSFSHLITHNPVLVRNYSQLETFKQRLKVCKFQSYFLDEKGRISNPDRYRKMILNPFNLNWYFVQYGFSEETAAPKIFLGQFLCENVCIAKEGPHCKSGQVLLVQLDSVVIRLAKPYLTTPGARVAGKYGQFIDAGDTLFTVFYEKSRSSDITQGLPKVEKVFEVRSIGSILPNLENRIEGWNEQITRSLGRNWALFIGTELTIAQSRIALVNEIQKIYRSQGVEIHNRHIEMVVRQITSKVVLSDKELVFPFLPGELIGLLQAEQMWRACKKPFSYRAILLGITKASLNTESFLSEASFQQTARVLSKAALLGRIDWLKGLKENVVLSRMIPAGTGFKGFGQENTIPLKTKKKNLFEGEVRDIFFYHREFGDSSFSNN